MPGEIPNNNQLYSIGFGRGSREHLSVGDRSVVPCRSTDERIEEEYVLAIRTNLRDLAALRTP